MLCSQGAVSHRMELNFAVLRVIRVPSVTTFLRGDFQMAPSLGDLMNVARLKIGAGLPMAEAEVLQLSRDILAAVDAEADGRDLSSEAFAVPEVLLELRKLIAAGEA